MALLSKCLNQKEKFCFYPLKNTTEILPKYKFHFHNAAKVKTELSCRENTGTLHIIRDMNKRLVMQTFFLLG